MILLGTDVELTENPDGIKPNFLRGRESPHQPFKRSQLASHTFWRQHVLYKSILIIQHFPHNNGQLINTNVLLYFLFFKRISQQYRFSPTTIAHWLINVNFSLEYCGFWSNRTLPYFPLSVRPPFVRPSVTGVTYQLFSIFWRFIPWKPYIFWMHII